MTVAFSLDVEFFRRTIPVALPALDFMLKLLMMSKKTEYVFFVDWLLSDRCYIAYAGMA